MMDYFSYFIHKVNTEFCHVGLNFNIHNTFSAAIPKIPEPVP